MPRHREGNEKFIGVNEHGLELGYLRQDLSRSTHLRCFNSLIPDMLYFRASPCPSRSEAAQPLNCRVDGDCA